MAKHSTDKRRRSVERTKMHTNAISISNAYWAGGGCITGHCHSFYAVQETKKGTDVAK